jgi:Trk-type K+ transport system membrane component
MRLKSQNQKSDDPHVSREALRQAFFFWLFWAAFVCLSALLITALLTGWPGFLHSTRRAFGP